MNLSNEQLEALRRHAKWGVPLPEDFPVEQLPLQEALQEALQESSPAPEADPE